MKEIDVLLGKEIKINGEKITIKPYTWAQAARMTRPISVIANAVVNNYDLLSKTIEAKPESVVTQVKSLIDFIAALDEEDDIIAALTTLMSAAAHKDNEWIESLMIDDAITLARTSFEVNKDFFTNRLSKIIPSKK